MKTAAASLLCLLVASTARATPADDSVRRIAILVGANHSPPGRAALSYSYRDAQSLADVLIEAGQFHRDDVYVLLDPDPQAVLDALDQQLALASALTKETLLVFYYSGHADDAALYPNGEPLSLQSLKERLDSASATVRIGIVDSCSGGGWTQSKGLQSDQPFTVNVPLTLTSEGSVLIASSSGLETAHESKELQGSFFTHHFVAGLRGAADRSGDGQITIGEAFAYAQERTIRDSAAQAESPQHPSFDIHLRGRHDLTLTQVDSSPSLVEVEEKVGPLQVIQLQSGLVVLEVPSGKRKLRLALPPGRYLVQRRSASQTFVREISVEAGKTLLIPEESLTLVGADELAGKGVPEPRPFSLETTLPGGHLQWILAAGVEHGSIGPNATIQVTSASGATFQLADTWGLTDRLEWIINPLTFAYRFGDRRGLEIVPWGGMNGVAFSSEGTSYALGAGVSLRQWLGRDFTLNEDVGTLSGITGPAAGPGSWAGELNFGFSKTFRNVVTVNLGTLWLQPYVVNGLSPPFGWRSGTIGVGSVSMIATRQLPLIQLHLNRYFSIDAYASVLFDFHGNIMDSYMGGVTLTIF